MFFLCQVQYVSQGLNQGRVVFGGIIGVLRIDGGEFVGVGEVEILMGLWKDLKISVVLDNGGDVYQRLQFQRTGCGYNCVSVFWGEVGVGRYKKIKLIKGLQERILFRWSNVCIGEKEMGRKKIYFGFCQEGGGWVERDVGFLVGLRDSGLFLLVRMQIEIFGMCSFIGMFFFYVLDL